MELLDICMINDMPAIFLHMIQIIITSRHGVSVCSVVDRLAAQFISLFIYNLSIEQIRIPVMSQWYKESRIP